jgi:single-strand DNA-binding protein
MDLNIVALTGRLGSDLELRHTKTGTAVTSASIAVDAGFGDNKKTLWVGLDFFGKTAESASKYLAKGKKIAISGRLDQSEYEKDGKTIQKTRVVVENWTFADSDKGGGGERPARTDAPRREEPRREPAPQQELPMGGDDDDEIPF